MDMSLDKAFLQSLLLDQADNGLSVKLGQDCRSDAEGFRFSVRKVQSLNLKGGYRSTKSRSFEDIDVKQVDSGSEPFNFNI